MVNQIKTSWFGAVETDESVEVGPLERKFTT